MNDRDQSAPDRGEPQHASDGAASDALPVSPPTILPSTAQSMGATFQTLNEPVEDRSRYQLTRLLAEGGLGRIHVATDTILNRTVALKEIKPRHLNSPEARRRFLLEAQVTGQLEHPNIVPIYDLAHRSPDGAPYYTMRLVGGRTLREVIVDYHRRRQEGTAGRVELTRLLTAFGGVCQAVAYAHSRGVVHRDLKPENVLLGEFGEVIVLDWGLAKLVGRPDHESDLAPVAPTDEANAGETMAGRVLGTPAYMAPEQAEGRVDLIDARTDIFGLGAILYEILTGRTPREGSSSLEVLHKAATSATPSARAIEPSVPSTLDAVCGRAMARERECRYASAAEVEQEVQRYLADEPVLACPETRSRRFARWMRHNRSWTLAAAAALILVSLVTAIAAVRLGHLAGAERSARLAANRLRTQGLRTAATFASRTVATEIDLRWRILEAEATDHELHGWLESLHKAGDGVSGPQRQLVQTWLEERHTRHSDAAKATSWIVLDHDGTILARSPLDAKVIGRNFAYRDYFHGLGHDLPSGTRGIPPIADVHRSRVYISKSTFQRMVAFSTPIRSSGSDGSETLGVLAMTVELGRFGSLRLDLGAGQVVVLAETLEDDLEGRPRKGLVLHHPYLVELRRRQAAGHIEELPAFRLDPIQVVALEKLRESRLRAERDRESQPDGETTQVDDVSVADNLNPTYADPVGGQYAGNWLAAFEPVLVHGRSAAAMDTGWVVIVQERGDGTAAF